MAKPNRHGRQPPINKSPVDHDWAAEPQPGRAWGVPGRARTLQGHRPHAQAQPLPKIIRGDKTGWGSPWKGEPTRQEPALLSNHDGANSPEPARLCNDLKQRGRPTGPPHPFKHGPQVRGEKEGGQQGRTWNLEPANPGWLDGPSTSPHLNSLNRLLDSAAHTLRSCPSSTPLPYAMFPIHQKLTSRLLLVLLLPQTSQTTRWDVAKCGLGHAVPNTVIDRQSAPPFEARA